jgi:uncharacterized protein (TIRG00374 family)
MDSVSNSAVELPGQSKQRSILPVIGRLLLGLGITAFLVWKADLSQIITAISRVELFWLAMAFAVQLVAKMIWSWRWWTLLNIYEIQSSFWRLVKGIYVGLFFSNFLPTSIGGDLYRAYWILDDKKLYAKSMFIVFIERFVGFVSLGYVAMIPFLLLLRQGLELGDNTAFILLVLVLLCGGVLALNPKVFEFFNGILQKRINLFAGLRRKIAEALHAWQGAGPRKWYVFLLSLGVHLAGITFFYSLGRGLQLPLNVWHYLVIVPLTVIATMLPISFNGLGVREGALIVLTAALGTSVLPAEAVALGLLSSIVSLLVSLIGGVFYVAGNVNENEAYAT